jgi:hypothetical protein
VIAHRDPISISSSHSTAPLIITSPNFSGYLVPDCGSRIIRWKCPRIARVESKKKSPISTPTLCQTYMLRPWGTEMTWHISRVPSKGPRALRMKEVHIRSMLEYPANTHSDHQ